MRSNSNSARELSCRQRIVKHQLKKTDFESIKQGLLTQPFINYMAGVCSRCHGHSDWLSSGLGLRFSRKDLTLAQLLVIITIEGGFDYADNFEYLSSLRYRRKFSLK